MTRNQQTERAPPYLINATKTRRGVDVYFGKLRSIHPVFS